MTQVREMHDDAIGFLLDQHQQVQGLAGTTTMNDVAGPVAAMLDRARDAFRS
jgi:hypothetical protein